MGLSSLDTHIRKLNKIFVIKHFNRQNRHVPNFSGHLMVRIHGRATNFLECSPVCCQDRQEVA